MNLYYVDKDGVVYQMMLPYVEYPVMKRFNKDTLRRAVKMYDLVWLSP